MVKNRISSLVTVLSFVLKFSTNLSFPLPLTLVFFVKLLYPAVPSRPALQVSDTLPVHLPISLLYSLSLTPAEVNFTTPRFLCCPTRISSFES